jgi:hypothetical protein
MIMGEMFNAFNISNLTVTSTTLDPANTALPGYSISNGVVTPGVGQTYSFGQASSRVGQTFGSGGPRAVQVGARFTF